MGTVYARGNVLWVGFVGPDGRWHYKSTGLRVGQEAEARRYLADIEAQIARGNRLAELGPLTVGEYGERWNARRIAHGQADAARGYRRFLKHLPLPLARTRLLDVRPMMVRDWVAGLVLKGLAPRSVSNVYGILHRLFADAVADELLEVSPCLMPRHEQPKRRDKNPAWRATAVYSRAEVELLVSSPLVSLERRVLYGLGFLAGLRFGEIAALRWSAYESDEEPLGRFSVHVSYTRHVGAEKGTKTNVVRQVPVHPMLARLLAEWRLTGWQAAQGRKPKPEDLLLPNQRGGHLTDNSARKTREAVAKALGLRNRRFHDTRRTFISLALADGANPSLLERITHNAKGDVQGLYNTPPWLSLCEAVGCLRIGRRGRTTVFTTARGAR